MDGIKSIMYVAFITFAIPSDIAYKIVACATPKIVLWIGQMQESVRKYNVVSLRLTNSNGPLQ